MCTVVFVPQDGGGFVLGHNRDERRSRPRAAAPEVREIAGMRYLAPLDPEGGGSWIGVNAAGLTACLLNAADPPGRSLPEKPPSRGRLIVHAMPHTSVEAAVAAIEALGGGLRETRAFQLVLAEPDRAGRPARLARLAWDGERLDGAWSPGPSLFVSSTIDPDGALEARRAAWSELLGRHPRPGRGIVSRWLTGHVPERGPTSVCMHRDEAATVSRSIVVVGRDGVELFYLSGQPCEPDAPEMGLAL